MIRVFPIAGPARLSDDFGVVRPGGAVGHQGIDIFADEGTPAVAVDSGQVRFGTDPKGGNVANVYASDGTRYYYAHLSSFAGTAPRSVTAGETIGYVGSSGNAVGTAPHVHFEEHPGNGPAVNPHSGLLAASSRRSPGGASAAKTLLALGLLGVMIYTLGPIVDRSIKQAARA